MTPGVPVPTGKPSYLHVLPLESGGGWWTTSQVHYLNLPDRFFLNKCLSTLVVFFFRVNFGTHFYTQFRREDPGLPHLPGCLKRKRASQILGILLWKWGGGESDDFGRFASHNCCMKALRLYCLIMGTYVSFIFRCNK